MAADRGGLDEGGGVALAETGEGEEKGLEPTVVGEGIAVLEGAKDFEGGEGGGALSDGGEVGLGEE